MPDFALFKHINATIIIKTTTTLATAAITEVDDVFVCPVDDFVFADNSPISG